MSTLRHLLRNSCQARPGIDIKMIKEERKK
jgi:hypothetical protein